MSVIADLLGEPVPSALSPVLSMATSSPKGRVYLRGSSEVVLPDYDVAFLQYGGPLNALTSDGRTELSISGAPYSTILQNGEFSIELTIDDTPNDKNGTSNRDSNGKSAHMFMRDNILHVPSTASVRVITSPVIVDSMITIGEKVTGESVERLIDGLAKRQLIMPLVYRTWLSPYGTVALTNLHIEMDGVAIRVQEYDSGVDYMEVQPLMVAYDKEASQRRMRLWLEETEGLSKPVTYTPLGYMPLRHVLRNTTGLTREGLESWLDAAVRIVVGNDAKVNTLYSTFSSPMKKVDNDAAHVAVNTIATLMYAQTSYAYDGHERITPQGVEFVNAEAWNENSPRSVQACGDCDDSAMFGMWICNQIHVGAQGAGTMGSNSSSRGPAEAFCCNALFHYEAGLAVTLASAGSGGELDAKPKLAGHATVLFLPIVQILEGLERAKEMESVGTSAETLLESYFDHFYPVRKRHLIGGMGLEEAVKLFNTAEPFVGEGTILSDARMYHQTREGRDAAALQLLAQKRKLKEIGTTLASSYVDLTTSAKTHTHEFYIKWIEVNFMAPIQVDSKRHTSQFVFLQYPLTSSGASPKKRIASGTTPVQLAQGAYALTPLGYENEENHALLERIFEEFQHHRMSPRAERPLNSTQTDIVRRNLERLDIFASVVEKLPESSPEMTAIKFLIPPRVLMGNNTSFERTLSSLQKIAKAGTYRRYPLDRSLGHLTDGATGAYMCVATLYV